MTSLIYFRKFWSDYITERLVDQTNLCSVEKTGESIKTTKEEMERVIGIQMLVSIVKLPRHEMSWSVEIRAVTSLFSLRHYKKLREFLHVVDSAEKEKEENKDDRLFKVEPERINSIDEQIIPAKTKRSGGAHQYNPKKLHKWDFKNLVRADQSGKIDNLFIYGGKNDNDGNPLTAKDFVLKLSNYTLTTGFQP